MPTRRRGAVWLAALAAVGCLAGAVAAERRLTKRSAEAVAQLHRARQLTERLGNELAAADRRLEELRHVAATLRAQPRGAELSVEAAPPTIGLDEALAFRPLKYPLGPWQPRGLGQQDCWFNSSDGERLNGWFFPHPHPRAAVLYLHGNGGNLSYHGPLMAWLRDRLEVSILIFDYRGFGRSSGVPTFAGLLLDARAARAELAKRAEVDPADLVLWGRSLGGTVAVELAARQGARGLIVESTFGSYREVAAVHYPATVVQAVLPERLAPLELIGHYRGPLLVAHGTADKVIPYRMGRALFERANEPKQFFRNSGAGHDSDLPLRFFVILDAFLETLR
jgi:fermentation-respiration switch protein FrsA (DUF1100 family)